MAPSAPPVGFFERERDAWLTVERSDNYAPPLPARVLSRRVRAHGAIVSER